MTSKSNVPYTIKHYPEIGFTVAYRPFDDNSEHVYDFRAYEIIGESDGGSHIYNRLGHTSSPDIVEKPEEAEVFLEGSVKWDGCSNWEFPETERVMLHFCGKEQAGNVGRLFEAIYDLAEEVIPAANFC